MDKLHLMAEALIKFETIDADQIETIMQGKEPGPPKDWTDTNPGSPPGGDGASASKKETKVEKKPDLSDPASSH